MSKKTGLTKEQLEMRKKMVTATDIGTIFGINKYKSPLTLWLEKTGRIEPEPVGEAARVGIEKEPQVAAAYKKRHRGVRLEKTGTHLKEEYYGATPERISHGKGDPCRLECKTSSLANAWRGGDYPDMFHLQVMWQMFVMDMQRADIFADLGSRYELRRVDRDEEQVNLCREAADRFWWHVKKDTAPEALGLEDDLKGLKLWFPEDAGFEMDASEKGDFLLVERREFKVAEKEAKAEGVRVEAEIKKLMGEASVLKSEVGRATWKKSKGRTTFDSKAAFDSLKDALLDKGLFPEMESAIKKIEEENRKETEGSRRFTAT